MSPKRQKTSSTDAAVQRQSDFSRDLSLLLSYANTREQLLIRLLAETGIQLKELVNLKKTSLRGRELILPSRKIFLSTKLAKTLAAHAQPSQDYFFATRQSAQLTTRRAEQLIANTAKNAGVQITARDIRKAYLAAAAQKATTDEQLKEMTGLKSITKARVLSEKEQTRLARVLRRQPARDKALVQTMLETGISLKETLALTRTDISSLRISTQLDSLLRTLAKQPEEHLFSTRQSTRLTTRRAEQIISSIGGRAKIKLTSHVLTTTASNGGAP